MMKLRVNLKENSYDIVIEKGCADRCGEMIREVTGGGRCVLITDSNVDALHAEKIARNIKAGGTDVVKFVFPAGEESKNIKTLENIYAFMADKKINRGDFIVALGGGVCGDTAGFAAATYMRGIKYVQIPTTLLAQVDSSVGGKVAVDLPQGKNMVGNFYHPKLVIIDPNFLDTLGGDFFADGMGEVIKYGCIRDRALFEKLLRDDVRENIEEVIYTCVDIKRQIVENDERDTGERMLLNFGHTVGHAVEKFYNYKGISHGMAVAVGMYVITKKSEAMGRTKAGTAEMLRKCLDKYGLPHETECAALDMAAEFAAGDKKNFGKNLNIVIIPEIGKSEILTLPLADFNLK